VAATDTVRKPSIDTMAYMVFDTTTNIVWHYKKATSNAWLRLGGSITSGLTGVLPVANGGTGSATQNFVDLTTNQTISSVKSFSDTIKGRNASFINTTSRNNIILLQSNDQSSLRLRFSNTGSGGRIYSIVGGLPGGNNSSFAIFDETDSKTRFEIKSDGSVNFQNSLAVSNTASNPSLTAGSTAISTYTPLSVGTQLVFGSSGDFPFYAWLQNRHASINDLAYPIAINPSGGSVGIGTTSPQSGYRLHVVDSIYVGGNVSAAAYTTRSDYNLKDDIFDLKYGLNDVLKLKPVEYTYKSNSSKQLGFIAQDIGTILPEVVSFEESMSVNYQAIIPILTKAMQEQQALIKALEQRIINLENK
jgi:hypothetical protein